LKQCDCQIEYSGPHGEYWAQVKAKDKYIAAILKVNSNLKQMILENIGKLERGETVDFEKIKKILSED
jgi:hypothetical protein